MQRRRIKVSEFERERGEKVREGTPRILGVQPGIGNVPIGPAPPHIRQVISTYDSRPIGGYDFVLSDQFSTYVETQEAFATTARGYVSVIRRIEITAGTGMVLAAPVSWLFTANRVVATDWTWNTGTLLSEAAVDTFFVVPPNTTISLRSVGLDTDAASIDVIVRFIGNLILDSNEPATEQVGSLPHAVKPIKP